MHRTHDLLVVTILLCVWGPVARAQVTVPNNSFEDGQSTPTGWTLTGGQGAVTSPGAAGARAISVTGDGKSSNAWQSPPLALLPDSVYRLRFQARRLQGTSGLPISGPAFCNRDLGELGGEWTTIESVFQTPHELSADMARVRFGQWEMDGSVAFDDVQLVSVLPVHLVRGELELGEGERLEGNQYTFTAPFQQASMNYARVLAQHQCTFNSNRWVLNESSTVLYRHHVGRTQTSAQVQLTIGWHQQGTLVVSASRDGRQWQEIGSLSGLGTVQCTVPTDLLPAAEIWIRLSARPATGAAQPPALQVHEYHYEATIDGPPAELIGATRFLAESESDGRLHVAIADLGEAIPGGNNVVTLRLRNASDRALTLRASAQSIHAPTGTGTPQDPGRPEPNDPLAPGTAGVRDLALPAGDGEQVVQIPYTLDHVGRNMLRIRIDGDARYCAETTIDVPSLYAADFGQVLPASSPEVGLWWCSSGWKVSSRRPAPRPTTRCEAMRIAAAANEAEAAQLVVRPARALSQLTVAAGELAGPAGATIAASQVEILRVRYLSVTRPTDESSTVGWWPDPLPPLSGPLTVEADRNLPLWVRVRVPRDQPPGVYRGSITLQADDYRAEVPLQVEVFGFAIPDRMTCQTAFGFDPSTAWRYHGVKTDALRRRVLDSYLQCLADHHISPNDPAPLDPIQVTWTGLPPWQGGERDELVRHTGRASLRVADESQSANAAATYQQRIPITRKGVKLSFWYRTRDKGHRFLVTLVHHDRAGRWMSGRNNDLTVTGDGTWQRFERMVTDFPDGARSFTVTLRATQWREDGALTGTVWYDDVSLIDLASNTEQLTDGGFESIDQPIPQPAFDFTAWDRAMQRAIDQYHFNTFVLHIPGLGGGTFHARYEPELLGFPEHTPQYEGALRAYLETLQSHLRERGWLDEAFVYWFDEPDPKDYAFVSNGFAKLKRWAPDIRRMLTEQVEEALIGGPNVWCPLTPSYDDQIAAQRRAAGDTFWWYVCTGPKAPYCTLFIDHPGTELRVWLWQTWQRQIAGVLVWQTNYWTSPAAYPDPERPQNPYEDPMGWVSGYDTPQGARRPWGNGDGRFLYPPESAADGRPFAPVLDPPVASIRLEMLRDGIEDYEYLTILRDRIAARRSTLSAAQLARYSALLDVPAAITTTLTAFTRDPAPIEQRREEIARAIEQLARD